VNGGNYRSFFVSPNNELQKRYEVLRSVFVDEDSMQEVAQRFGLGYGTIRNWVSEFRRSCDAGLPPPFLFRQDGDVHQMEMAVMKGMRIKRP
jgi:transposase